MTLQKNTHSFRVEAEKAGIGMMAGATYVSSKFDADAVKATTALDKSTLKWEKAAFVYVAKGNKGQLARHCEKSECGKFVRFTSGAVLSLKTIACEVHTLADFGAALLKKAEYLSIKRAKGGETFEGFAFGSLGDIYSVCVQSHNGNVTLADVETRANEYNTKVLCTLGDRAKVAANAEALALALQTAIGARTGKVVKKERAAVRARKVAAKAAGKVAAK